MAGASTVVVLDDDEESRGGSHENDEESRGGSHENGRRLSYEEGAPVLDAEGKQIHELARELLVERLELERGLYSGLRMVILCAALFSSLIMVLHYQTDKDAQFALQESYADTFDLAAASTIVAPYQLRDALRVFSENVRTLQVLSSDFFVETEGQLKILSGIKDFLEAQVIEVEGLMPRVDTASFTFSAWVQRNSIDSSGYILRKPLGRGREQSMSCYGWFIGRTNIPQVVFGAHDVGLLDQSLNEEQVTAGGQWEVDQAFHLEMIVVNATTINFFRDAQLRSSLPLRRPITDCSGGALMVGDRGLRMAEVTFYARELSQTEIEEIFFAGFTFEAIAAGKVPFAPKETEFDRLLGAQDEAVSTLLSSNDYALGQAVLGRVLTQALIKELQETPTSPSLPIAVAPDAGCAREWPPCQSMRGVNDTLTLDTFTGKEYYNLIPPEARNGGGPQDRYVGPPPVRPLMLQYDAPTFPTWAGQSVTFSVWVKPTFLGSLLSKSSNANQVEMCWSLLVDPVWGIGTQGLVIRDDGWLHPHNMIRWGGDIESGTGYEPIKNNGKKFRHLAWVFDASTNSLRAYVDGTLVADNPFLEADTVGRLDCGVTADTYIGFLHRPPGGLPYYGEIQDFRMYVGTALTGAEIKGLSEGEGSITTRECSLSTEGQDANYKDMNGNNCAWYQEAVAPTEAVCSATQVKEQCPVACGQQEPCFEKDDRVAPTYQIWEKIMRIQPKIEGLGTFCVREGLDPVQECVAAMMRRDPKSFPPDGSMWGDAYTTLFEGGFGEWNLTNCEFVYAMTDPSCSFKVPGEWTKTFDSEVKTSGEFTLSFWFKAQGKDQALLGEGVDLWMTFYSSVAPPIPLLRIVGYSGVMVFQIWGREECGAFTEDVNMLVTYEPGEWNHIALTFGAPRGAGGERHMQLVKDSVFIADVKNRAWCDAPPGREFLQAISILQPYESLLSPIQITAKATSVKASQLEYYQLRPAFRWRRGPQQPEATRLSRPVTYQENQYDAPGALLAPPILLQRRLQLTSECAAESGSSFQEKVWRDATLGMTCSPPYECSQPLLDSPSELMRCRGTKIADRFLGRGPIKVRGEDVFAEFLPSIADASILVRGGELFETSKFIDTQTDSLTLPVVLFSPNAGIITLIQVVATFTSRVTVSYTVKQFQSIEGNALDSAITQAMITIAFVILSLLELGIQAFHKLMYKDGREIKYILMDVVVLAIIPVLFLALRIDQLRDSNDIMAKATGEEGLGGVPWASTSIPLDEKMDRFFSGLEELQGHIDREQRMTVLGFVSALLLLVRVIFATKAHPRTAVLVHTILAAADDLWHFVLLFLVLFLGFGALAWVSFGMKINEFSTLAQTFETLFDMMLGSLPRSGGGGGAKQDSWTADPLLVIFVALFNFLVFFVMLNFIIAIIVESYLSTKKRVDDELTEQEIFTDILASMRALVYRLMRGWPTHSVLIKALKESEDEAVTPESLAVIFNAESNFGTWDEASIKSFVDHYEEYDFLCPAKVAELKKYEGLELVQEIETRVINAIRNGSTQGGSPMGPASMGSRLVRKNTNKNLGSTQPSQQSQKFEPTTPMVVQPAAAQIPTEVQATASADRKGAWAEEDQAANQPGVPQDIP